MAAAADTSAELVELADAESLCVDDDHHRRIGNVHTDLDHGGGHDRIDLSAPERVHDLVLLVGG